MIYLFDVDNTLTEPRRPISEEMTEWLYNYSSCNMVFTVTGSPLWMYQEQIPVTLSRRLAGEFWCSGNHYRIGNRYVKQEFNDPPDLLSTLFRLWKSSQYPTKDGCYMEARPGALYYATCGVYATPEEREDYKRWNTRTWEREAHVNILKQSFPNLEVCTGGEVSIDILNKGKDKRQVLEYIPDDHQKIIFFGDKIREGGNDYTLAKAVEARGNDGGEVVRVTGPGDTLRHLRERWQRR